MTTEDPVSTRPVEIPQDGHVYRHFKLLTNGDDKVLDALHICYSVLSELQDGADIEANLRYLIARFSVQLPYQIIPRMPEAWR